MNTINNLRAIEFLTESSKIDDISINYTSPEHQTVGKGYFGAFIDSQADATKREPLNLHKIVHWQQMIADEDLSKLEDPSYSESKEKNLSSLSNLLIQVNQSLEERKWYDDAEFCKIVGNSLKEFTELHPFLDKENGKMARLIANYLATYCGKPLLVFKSTSSEKDAYQIAIASPQGMWIFIAQKIQEAVYSLSGELMVPMPVSREEDKLRMSTMYKSTSSNEELLVQWHKIKHAIEEWKKQIIL